MANRFKDWLKQADADLAHARNALYSGGYEWSCFACQQAAEKALKSLFQYYGMEAWGHSVTILLGSLEERFEISEHLKGCAKTLDKHYIPTRYPNGFDAGAPVDYYTSDEAEHAIKCAEAILEYCHNTIGG